MCPTLTNHKENRVADMRIVDLVTHSWTVGLGVSDQLSSVPAGIEVHEAAKGLFTKSATKAPEAKGGRKADEPEGQVGLVTLPYTVTAVQCTLAIRLLPVSYRCVSYGVLDTLDGPNCTVIQEMKKSQ